LTSWKGTPHRTRPCPWAKEYWIGDPANKALEILTLKEGRYELHCSAEGKGRLASLVLAVLEFDLTEIQQAARPVVPAGFRSILVFTVRVPLRRSRRFDLRPIPRAHRVRRAPIFYLDTADRF